jgi:hypothetical protein
MDHTAIKTMLSAYLENAVSPQEKAKVEEHLAACPECRLSLTEMMATRQHIRSLGEIEPPPWLTGKIMARVREEGESKRSILGWLFFPLHKKLPIGAVGLIFLTVMVYYIIRELQPELKNFPAGSEEMYEKEGPSKNSEITSSVKPPEKKREVFQKEESRSPAESPAAPEPKGGVSPPSGGVVTQPEDFARKQAIAPQTQAGQGRRVEEANAKPVERSEISDKQEAAPSPARQRAESAFKDRVLKEGEKMSAPPRLAAGGVPRDTQTPHLTLTTRDAPGAGRKLEEAVPPLGGKIIKKELIGKIQIFSVQMAAEKMGEFKATLESLGKIQEPEWPAQETEGDRLLTIEILPASPQP